MILNSIFYRRGTPPGLTSTGANSEMTSNCVNNRLLKRPEALNGPLWHPGDFSHRKAKYKYLRKSLRWNAAIICFLGLLTYLNVEAAKTSTSNPAPVLIFIIAGQSNAEGHNHFKQYQGGHAVFPEELRHQPAILFWPGTNVLQEQVNLWTSLRVGESGAFGPEISFAKTIQQKQPDAKIGIIKFASGGTGIARSSDYTDYIPAVAGFNDKDRNWHPPTDGREPGSLYRGLIANVRGAFQALDREGKSWTLCGFIWMQGEHEASISRKMADDYERLLADFISSVRKDLHTPALPVIIGQVNSHDWIYGDIARKAQSEVCKKDSYCRLVQTVDLPRVQGDAAHFTADGMLTLGTRFAEAMISVGCVTAITNSVGK
jgi:hypothetical protein